MPTGDPSARVETVRAPDFALGDHSGCTFRLAEHLGSGPLLVVFFRGHWCPYCRRYLGKLRDHYARLRDRGARVVAVSPEPTATSRALAEDLSLPFPLLSDLDGAVMDGYGTRNGFRSASAILPHPSVFLLDPDGFIRFRSIDRNYKRRTTVRTMLGWLDEISGAAQAPPAAAPVPA